MYNLLAYKPDNGRINAQIEITDDNVFSKCRVCCLWKAEDFRDKNVSLKSENPAIKVPDPLESPAINW